MIEGQEHLTAQLAAVAAIVWGLTVVGVRNAIHIRRTGRSAIFLRSTARLGWTARVGGALHIAALACAVLAIRREWLGDARLWETENWRVRGIAFVVYFVGLAGTFASQLAMSASWRIGVDSSTRTELVVGGPFRYVRNPIYSFVILTVASLPIAAPNAWSFASFALCVIGLELHVRFVEEPFLIAAHGEPYLAWASRTGRFVPWIGRLEGARARGA